MLSQASSAESTKKKQCSLSLPLTRLVAFLVRSCLPLSSLIQCLPLSLKQCFGHFTMIIKSRHASIKKSLDFSRALLDILNHQKREREIVSKDVRVWQQRASGTSAVSATQAQSDINHVYSLTNKCH